MARGTTELKEGPHQADGKEQVLNRLRRHTVQVCDVHRRLKDVDLQTFQDLAVPVSVQRARHSFADFRDTSPTNGTDSMTGQNRAGSNSHIDIERMQPHVDERSLKLDKLYTAAVIADQNAKLSIFATRPAIYAPLFNFLTEFMCTTALIFGALLMYARRDQLPAEERALFRSFEGMWIGFFVFVCILGLGGPTGIAANPARDMSPRLAHFLLPIPGKGPSEWYYGLWIPTLAPLLGGGAAAGLYYVVQLMNHSNV